MPMIEISDEYMFFVNAIVDLQKMLADSLHEPVAFADAHTFVEYLIQKEIDILGGKGAIIFMRAALSDPVASKLIKKKLSEFLETLKDGAGADPPEE